jgi:hypothetical protein
MTEDERIDEIIKSAARDYNRPPVTPREDMWTAIQAARTTAASGPRLHVAAGGSAVSSTYEARSRFSSRYTWLGMAAAASLLIATGVGIGRWTSRPVSGSSVAAAKQSTLVATNNTPTVAEPESAAATQPVTVAVAPSAGANLSTPASRSPEEIRKSPHIIGTKPLRPLNGSGSDRYGSSAFASTPVSYQVATQRHLEDAEALLTSYSLEGRDPRMDAQFAGWAKGLLSNTRLLLDSPAGDDPRRAKLLQDLELVLAQIVQLSPNAAATDRELIQGSIQNQHVMTRLRSAIPADQPRGILEK